MNRTQGKRMVLITRAQQEVTRQARLLSTVDPYLNPGKYARWLARLEEAKKELANQMDNSHYDKDTDK
jgi:hypothetical protein